MEQSGHTSTSYGHCLGGASISAFLHPLIFKVSSRKWKQHLIQSVNWYNCQILAVLLHYNDLLIFPVFTLIVDRLPCLQGLRSSSGSQPACDLLARPHCFALGREPTAHLNLSCCFLPFLFALALGNFWEADQVKD